MLQCGRRTQSQMRLAFGLNVCKTNPLRKKNNRSFMLDWIKGHFNKLHQLQLNTTVTDLHGEDIGLAAGFEHYIEAALTTRAKHSKIIFIGNGGSAGIAS